MLHYVGTTGEQPLGTPFGGFREKFFFTWKEKQQLLSVVSHLNLREMRRNNNFAEVFPDRLFHLPIF